MKHIRIISPSGAIDPSFIDGAATRLRAWGYIVSEGAHARDKWGRFAGSLTGDIATLISGGETSAAIRDRYYNGFFGDTTQYTPKVFSRLFDEPTYLTFRIEFDFNTAKMMNVIKYKDTGNDYITYPEGQKNAMTLFSSDLLATGKQFNSNWQADTANLRHRSTGHFRIISDSCTTPIPSPPTCTAGDSGTSWSTAGPFSTSCATPRT